MNIVYLKYGFLFLLALLLQSTVIPAIQILTWRPDIVLIVLVMFAVNHGRIAGSTAGFFVGFISDLISWKILGIGALSKSISGYVAAVFGEGFRERNRLWYILFLTSFVHEIISQFFYTMGTEIVWSILIMAQIFPEALYTVIVGKIIDLLLSDWLQSNE